MEETRQPDATDVLSALGADEPAARGRKWIRVLTISGIVALLAATAWYVLLPGEQSITYKTEPVTRHDLAVTITATGQLAPVNQVDVGSELSGTVAKVNVDYNDIVTRGQVLATLDTSELDASVVEQKAALKVAQARVAQAAATLTESKLNYDRSRNLVAQKLASQADLDASHASLKRAQADLAGARAQVDQAAASLDAITSKLAKSTIRAPINGIILSRSVEPGQTVAASFNTPVLFSLAENLARMELHVDVDEADVGHLKAGQPATFSVDAWPGRVFAANVTQVRFAPRTVEGVVTYETLLSVDNSDLSLRPGMTATAEITVANLSNALLVPNAALRFSPPVQSERKASANIFTRLMPRRHGPTPASRQTSARSTLWKLVKGAPQPVTVTAGMTNGRYTAITGGELAPGDLVITGVATASRQ